MLNLKLNMAIKIERGMSCKLQQFKENTKMSQKLQEISNKDSLLLIRFAIVSLISLVTNQHNKTLICAGLDLMDT